MQFDQLRRREFIAVLSGAAAWPLAARAQQPRKLPTIGFVGPSTAAVDRTLTGPFAQRLAELGWVDSRSIVIEYHPSEGLVERRERSQLNSFGSRSMSS
jgi:putative ABC transport system substrate-binding protein